MAARGGIAPTETRSARDLPRRQRPRARSQAEYEGFGPADTESGRARGMRPPKRGTSQAPEAGPPKPSDYRPGGALNNPRTTVPSGAAQPRAKNRAGNGQS